MIIYLNDFVIVKTFGKKPYSVSKKFYINKNYPTYEFKTYQQAINFIKDKNQ